MLDLGEHVVSPVSRRRNSNSAEAGIGNDNAKLIMFACPAMAGHQSCFFSIRFFATKNLCLLFPQRFQAKVRQYLFPLNRIIALSRLVLGNKGQCAPATKLFNECLKSKFHGSTRCSICCCGHCLCTFNKSTGLIIATLTQTCRPRTASSHVTK